MNPQELFNQSPLIRPQLNLGCLFDILTGTYFKGIHGESILNGGLSNITGITGRGNTHKSTLSHFMLLKSLNRYTHSFGMIYDTELTLRIDRLEQLNLLHKTELPIDFYDNSRFLLTDRTIDIGNKWFDKYEKYFKYRRENQNKLLKETPFKDAEGKPFKALSPFVTEVDSLSQMKFDSVEKMYEKNEIGDAGLNTEAVKEMSAKSQLISRLPGLVSNLGGYIILTAHLGDDVKLEMFPTNNKKLNFLKNNTKFKRVPENFTMLLNNCWLALDTQVLNDKATKKIIYPRNTNDDLENDSDLMLVTYTNLRGKSGVSGIPFKLVISQSEGVLEGLSEFINIKDHNGFGIGGNDKNYYLELCPDVSLKRTSIRGKLEENELLKRAMEFTSEISQMKQLWHHIAKQDPDLLCEPKTLFEDLKNNYDWDILLNTRGYWMFIEDETPSTKPYLSTMDLLKMRKGLYHPWWYDKFVGKIKEV